MNSREPSHAVILNRCLCTLSVQGAHESDHDRIRVRLRIHNLRHHCPSAAASVLASASAYPYAFVPSIIAQTWTGSAFKSASAPRLCSRAYFTHDGAANRHSIRFCPFPRMSPRIIHAKRSRLQPSCKNFEDRSRSLAAIKIYIHSMTFHCAESPLRTEFADMMVFDLLQTYLPTLQAGQGNIWHIVTGLVLLVTTFVSPAQWSLAHIVLLLFL